MSCSCMKNHVGVGLSVVKHVGIDLSYLACDAFVVAASSSYDRDECECPYHWNGSLTRGPARGMLQSNGSICACAWGSHSSTTMRAPLE
jgi:hypothetical protein